MARLVTEFIGTFFLVLIIGLLPNPFAIGLGLAALVYMGGHISGAHYNPAVSLGMFMRGILNVKELLSYWIAQIAGSIFAALSVFMILEAAVAPAPAPNVNLLNAIFVEFLFTFALVLVVLNVATTKKNQPNSYYGMAIGFTILAAATVGGPISGGAFNPAVGLGPIIVSLITTGYPLKNLPVYLIGPFLGGFLASFVFKYTNPDEFKDTSMTYHES